MALEKLAIVWEWQIGEPARALTITEQALSNLNGGDEKYRRRLLHRRDRLLRKVV